MTTNPHDSNDNDAYVEDDLYEHMPVYQARLASVRELIETSESLDLSAFHMHYNGVEPLQRALRFFDEPTALLDLGCGYGSNAVWFAERCASLKTVLGVDLMSEHVEIADLLAARFRPGDARLHFLAKDIALLDQAEFERCAGTRQADAVLALNTFLHLNETQRIDTWRFLLAVLKPGGRVYVEDFFAKRTLTKTEHDTMVSESGCALLPSLNAHAELVAGVLPSANVEVEDITDIYAGYAEQRHINYTGGDAKKQRFYRTVCEMLNGPVGGIRLKVSR